MTIEAFYVVAPFLSYLSTALADGHTIAPMPVVPSPLSSIMSSSSAFSSSSNSAILFLRASRDVAGFVFLAC